MTEGWSETTLGQVADYQNGYPFRPSELTGRGLPVVRIKQLLDPSAEADLSDADVGTRHLVGDGDLIFSWSGTLASRIWDRGPALLNQHLFRVAERPGVHRLWLHLALDHAVGALMAKSHGTTMKHVTKKVLEAHPVLLPPPPVQRRIADLIGAFDNAISALAEEALALEGVLTHQRQQLDLTSDVPLDRILVGIDSGRSVLTGGDAPVDRQPRILKISAVLPASFDATEAKALDRSVVMPEAAHVREGDLLITRSNTPSRVGYCARARQVPEGTYMPDLVWRLRLDEGLCDPDYFEQAMASPEMRSRVTSTASGTSASMRKINKRGFAMVRLPLPPLEEQGNYARTCLTISSLRTALGAEKQALQALRSRLVADLLAGAVSVPVSYDALLREAV